MMIPQIDNDEGHSRLSDWLVWHHILHVNHWWGFTVRGWHVFWAWGRLNITRNYPHTEN